MMMPETNSMKSMKRKSEDNRIREGVMRNIWRRVKLAAALLVVSLGLTVPAYALTEDEAAEAMNEYIDVQYGLDTVLRYHGWICYQGEVGDYYCFLFRKPRYRICTIGHNGIMGINLLFKKEWTIRMENYSF